MSGPHFFQAPVIWAFNYLLRYVRTGDNIPGKAHNSLLALHQWWSLAAKLRGCPKINEPPHPSLSTRSCFHPWDFTGQVGLSKSIILPWVSMLAHFFCIKRMFAGWSLPCWGGRVYSIHQNSQVKNSHHHKTWLGSQLHQVHAVNSASVSLKLSRSWAERLCSILQEDLGLLQHIPAAASCWPSRGAG